MVIKKLEDKYRSIVSDNRQYGENSALNKAFADGFNAAIRIVKEQVPQEKTNRAEEAVPLYRMAPEKVAALDLRIQFENHTLGFSSQILTEAAFRFENQLMAALGDENTIPFEMYENLNDEKLIDIILVSTEKICRIENK